MFTNNKQLINYNIEHFCDCKISSNSISQCYTIIIKNIENAKQIADSSLWYIKNTDTLFVDLKAKNIDKSVKKHILHIYNYKNDLCFSFCLSKYNYYFDTFNKMLSENNFFILFKNRNIYIDRVIELPKNISSSCIFEFEIIDSYMYESEIVMLDYACD